MSEVAPRRRGRPPRRQVNYRELNAVDLVKQWAVIVNDSINIGRDSHMMKVLLQQASGMQILLGMYHYKAHPTMSIPMFCREILDWIEEDEEYAEIELACCISNVRPLAYYIFEENRDELGPNAREATARSRAELLVWKDRVLG